MNSRWKKWVVGAGIFIMISGFIIIATLAGGGTENPGGLGAAIGGMMLIGFGLCTLVFVLIISIFTTIFPNKEVESDISDVPVIFDGWFVNSNKVDSIAWGQRVMAMITMPSGFEGNYHICFRRDIESLRNVADTVLEIPFEPGSDRIVKEISFVPQICIGERKTRGYFIDLVKNGHIVWTMDKTYPPRLRVTNS